MALFRRTVLSMTVLLLHSCSGCASPFPNLDDATRDFSSARPVVPDLIGFGVDTPAGRGGELVRVTTLADDGPGSLREALSPGRTPGPRVVVFEVSGVIELERNLPLEDSFVTIAGQTAPPPGITLTNGGLSIRGHDVLVQHLTIRVGDGDSPDKGQNRDALEILGDESGDTVARGHVVIDHCSLSWGIDETFSTWYPVADVTVANSIISESLDDSLHPEGPHSKGFLIGDHTRRLAMHGNLLAHHDDRNPIIKGDSSALVARNVIYNPGRWPVTIGDRERSGPSLATVVDNVFIPGEDTPPEHAAVYILPRVSQDSKLYMDGNDSGGLAQYGTDGDVDPRVDTPPVWIEPALPRGTEGLLDAVLGDAGARPAERDAIDRRIVREVRAGTGRIIDSQDEVGGLPELGSQTRAFEAPEDPSGDDDGDGYTNLEEVLHAMSAALEGR